MPYPPWHQGRRPRSLAENVQHIKRCLLVSVTLLHLDYTWVTPRSLLNSENPGIFQLVTQIIAATRATSLAVFGSLKLISARLPLGLNQRHFKIHGPLCTSMLNAHRRGGVGLPSLPSVSTWGNLGKPVDVWNLHDSQVFLSHQTPPWREGSLLHVSCTEPHIELPGPGAI